MHRGNIVDTVVYDVLKNMTTFDCLYSIQDDDILQRHAAAKVISMQN